MSSRYLRLLVAAAAMWLGYVGGPDVSGVYGGAQGVGGLLAYHRPSDGVVFGVVNNSRGHVAGYFNGGTVGSNGVLNAVAQPVVTWVPPLDPGGKGASTQIEGTDGSLQAASIWEGRRLDPTGLYYMGARYYDPVAGRFLSPDPFGHSASLTLYDYANGDPINGYDPDGRWGASMAQKASSMSAQNDPNVSNNFWSIPYGLIGALAQVPEGIHSTFAGASVGMAAARAEINTYTGAKALLARPLQFAGDLAFGATSLVVNTGETVQQVPAGFHALGERVGEDLYKITDGPLTINKTFDVLEDGFSVFGIMSGGVALKRVAVNAGVSGVSATAKTTLDLPAPRQVAANWGMNTYKHGGEMYAIEHIMYRHASNSGFANVSRFAEGTGARHIQGMVDDALRYGKQTGVGTFEYGFGRAIGTNQGGGAANGIRVHIRDGNIQTAFPITIP